MAVSEIALHIPFLRRFARALIGSRAAADAEVAAMLQALIDGRLQLEPGMPLRMALFQAFCATAAGPAESVEAGGNFHEDRLRRLDPLARRAYLLVVMEQFSAEEAGAILELPAARVAEIVAEVEAEMAEGLGISPAAASGNGAAIRIDREAAPGHGTPARESERADAGDRDRNAQGPDRPDRSGRGGTGSSY